MPLCSFRKTVLLECIFEWYKIYSYNRFHYIYYMDCLLQFSINEWIFPSMYCTHFLLCWHYAYNAINDLLYSKYIMLAWYWWVYTKDNVVTVAPTRYLAKLFWLPKLPPDFFRAEIFCIQTTLTEIHIVILYILLLEIISYSCFLSLGGHINSFNCVRCISQRFVKTS